MIFCMIILAVATHKFIVSRCPAMNGLEEGKGDCEKSASPLLSPCSPDARKVCRDGGLLLQQDNKDQQKGFWYSHRTLLDKRSSKMYQSEQRKPTTELLQISICKTREQCLVLLIGSFILKHTSL